jgi:hypothetical protein
VTKRERSLETTRAAGGYGVLANLQLAGIAELRYRQVHAPGVNLDYGHVRVRIPADHFAGNLLAVPQAHLDFTRPFHDVIVRYDVTLLVVDKTRRLPNPQAAWALRRHSAFGILERNPEKPEYVLKLIHVTRAAFLRRHLRVDVDHRRPQSIRYILKRLLYFLKDGVHRLRIDRRPRNYRYCDYYCQY